MISTFYLEGDTKVDLSVTTNNVTEPTEGGFSFRPSKQLCSTEPFIHMLLTCFGTLVPIQ
jgi:hypothetical protein